MSADNEKTSAKDLPANPEKRDALKKLGHYLAYTAPAALVLVGYVAAAKEGMAISLSPPPPPPPPPP
jgi:hypothetical protein